MVRGSHTSKREREPPALAAGSIWRPLVALSLPTALALALQSLYALVDLAWVAGLGTSAVAGLGIGIQGYFLVFALGQVLGTTSLAEVSQHLGGGRPEAASRAMSTACAAGLALGALGAVACFVLAEPFVGLFSVDPQTVAQGSSYLRATALTFVTQTLLIVLGSALRGAGDALTPMLVLGVTVGLNLVLDPLCIYGLELGVAGAGWATVSAQLVGLTVYVRRLSGRSSLRWSRPQLSPAYVRMILRRGLPAGLQHLLFGATLAVLLAAVRSAGASWTAAVGGGFRVLQQALVPLFAVATAAASIAGQSAGAGDQPRASRAWAAATGLATGLALLLLGGILAAAASLGVWFSPGAELEAEVFYRWTAPSLLGFAPALVATLVLQTLRRPVLPMAAACLRFVILALGALALLPRLAAGPEWVLALFTLTIWLEAGLDLWLFWRHRR